jgi:hypothetical protein
MPMNSGLTSAKSEFSKSPLATRPSNEPPLHPSELNLITRARLWLDKVVPFAFVRFLMIFFIGVAATLAGQSYGDAARGMIASLSPQLDWLAPQAAPVAQTAPGASGGASPDQLAAISRGLAVVRQNVDKVAADITKLQATQQGALDRTSAPPPSPAGVPSRKPVPAPSRAPPVR